MRATLFPFQETALDSLHEKIRKAHIMWSEKDPQIIIFSAPTGAGKTIMMTALFEEIIFGHPDGIAEPDSVFVWLSDMPELNEQTRRKIESKSDRFRARDIHVIDSSFDAEFFPPGSINFLNTQKLGSDKRLTQGGERSYTIWQTLANTAKRQPKSFYVIIDEAHRGTYTSRQAEDKAQSIMQKFIKGSKEDGLPPLPLVIGVTATPQRFQRLTDGMTSTTQGIKISPDDVRESGLLKDRIIIHFPETAIGADMTMFTEAVINWKTKCSRWSAYCDHEGIQKPVRPILVVQVEDGNERTSTQTNLTSCIHILEKSLGRRLRPGEAVHTFDKRDTLKAGGVNIRKIDASHIEEDETAMVVFFKMNLSTGWDCPRAETMMSFRHANDYTYIAQLLGRMIRTPLARRVESDAELNNVGLFLPFFDEETVKKVESALQDNEAIAPAETGTNKELVTLARNPNFADIFGSMDLVTYRIPTTRRQPALRRLVALARALTQDRIAPQARKSTLKRVLDKFEAELTAMKQSGRFDTSAAAVTALFLRTLTIDYRDGDAGKASSAVKTVELSDADIGSLFEKAGKVLGEGLHKEYWKRHAGRDPSEVKTEMIVLAGDNQAMEHLEEFSGRLFHELFDSYRGAFRELSEGRRDIYNKLAMASATPIPLAWELPQAIDFYAGQNGQDCKQHLFIPAEGNAFSISLGNWEDGVMEEERRRDDFVAWLRNLDRKRWSLEIPYEACGVIVPMFPDLIIVRSGVHGYVFDILEPHDPSRKDNYPKAVGLAKFAEKHGELFGRIQLIRKKKGPDMREHFYRLDMGKIAVRESVRGVTSNTALDQIFERYAVTEEPHE